MSSDRAQENLEGLACLVVDDDSEVREMLVGTVEALGISALHAESAEAAAILIDSGRRVDLLLSDVSMPGGDSGIGLLAAVRAGFPSLPCVLISGLPDFSIAECPEFEGTATFLPKPFRREELAAAFRESMRLTSECSE